MQVLCDYVYIYFSKIFSLDKNIKETYFDTKEQLL